MRSSGAGVHAPPPPHPPFYPPEPFSAIGGTVLPGNFVEERKRQREREREREEGVGGGAVIRLSHRNGECDVNPRAIPVNEIPPSPAPASRASLLIFSSNPAAAALMALVETRKHVSNRNEREIRRFGGRDSAPRNTSNMRYRFLKSSTFTVRPVGYVSLALDRLEMSKCNASERTSRWLDSTTVDDIESISFVSTGGAQIRHSLSDVRAVRQPCQQHAGTVGGRRIR